MKKYVAYRINKTRWSNATNSLVNGWFIQGQRSTDLNWENISSESDEETALAKIRSIREKENKGEWCPIYGPNGYGYKE